jgi:hypothetical protein
MFVLQRLPQLVKKYNISSSLLCAIPHNFRWGFLPRPTKLTKARISTTVAWSVMIFPCLDTKSLLEASLCKELWRPFWKKYKKIVSRNFSVRATDAAMHALETEHQLLLT